MTGYLSGLLLICGYFLFYLAICRFTGASFFRLLVYGFLPLGILVLTLSAILNLHWLPLIDLSLVLGFGFNIATVLTLYRSDYSRYKLSAYTTAIPLLLYAVILIGRLIAGFISRVAIMPVPSFTSIFSAMALFVFSYLWTSGFILMISQRLQGDLNDLAMNDALTRVRNRRAMQEMLNFEMRRLEKDVRDFSIILLDLDYFKRVNDRYGHDMGDRVLQWMASTLQNHMRAQDVVARWGGEEFLILLPDTALEEAMQIANRLHAVVNKTAFELPTEALKVTFSAGVACSKTNREVNHLCKVADQALYRAKQTRNIVVSQDVISTRRSSSVRYLPITS